MNELGITWKTNYLKNAMTVKNFSPDLTLVQGRQVTHQDHKSYMACLTTAYFYIYLFTLCNCDKSYQIIDLNYRYHF